MDFLNLAVIQVMMERDVVFFPTKQKSSIFNSNRNTKEEYEYRWMLYILNTFIGLTAHLLTLYETYP